MEPEIPSGEPPFAAFVAIDWADRKHVWALQEAGSQRREQGEIEHTPEAIATWAVGLATRFQGRPVAVALEQARGALLYALSQYAHLVLYPIHPAMSARFRAALFPSGAKDDPQDAALLLDLLVGHRSRLRPWQPDSEPIRQLQRLVELRRDLVDEKTRQGNRLTAQLKLYFPQMLDWCDEVGSAMMGDMLERWPRLEDLQRETPETLRNFFYQHRCRSAERLQERLEQIPKAQPILRDRAVIEPAVLLVQTLVRLLATLRESIAQAEEQIEQVATAQPDYLIFESLPGAGEALAPRLLAAMGSRRERFASAQEIQAYSGIAPVVARSGKQEWVHFRWACPKFLRQSFHEFAAHSTRKCAWARAFYDEQRARGKGHHAAVRALAFKWIRILFRCWQDRTPYDDQRYCQAIEKRRPAPAQLTPTKPTATPPKAPASATPKVPRQPVNPPVNIVCKDVGGFWKFFEVTP